MIGNKFGLVSKSIHEISIIDDSSNHHKCFLDKTNTKCEMKNNLRLTRFERATCRSAICCSIQLSYNLIHQITRSPVRRQLFGGEDSPSGVRHPASQLQVGVFTKPAFMPVYRFKSTHSLGSNRSQKPFESPNKLWSFILSRKR